MSRFFRNKTDPGKPVITSIESKGGVRLGTQVWGTKDYVDGYAVGYQDASEEIEQSAKIKPVITSNETREEEFERITRPFRDHDPNVTTVTHADDVLHECSECDPFEDAKFLIDSAEDNGYVNGYNDCLKEVKDLIFKRIGIEPDSSLWKNLGSSNDGH